MIRFTWLRFRAQAAVAFGALVVVAIILALTGFHMAAVYNAAVAPCQPGGDCAAALHAFPPAPDRTVWGLLDDLVIAAPGLIGVFWGGGGGGAAGRAQVRDRHVPPGLDPGDQPHPLAGGQARRGRRAQHDRRRAAQRPRDLVVKAARAGVVVEPDHAHFVPHDRHRAGRVRRVRLRPRGHGRAPHPAHPARDGGHARHLRRRAVRGARLPPAAPYPAGHDHRSAQRRIGRGMGRDRRGPARRRHPVRRDGAVRPRRLDGLQRDRHPGRPSAGTEPATAACGNNTTQQSCQAYVAALHLRQVETYQPGSRYWPLQWYETGIYLAAALLLAGLCFLRIRRGRPRSDVRSGPGQPPVVLQSRRPPADSHQSA